MTLIESLQTQGVSFMEALQKTSYWIDGTDEDASEESSVQAMSDDDVAQMNAANLAELERVMMGVKKRG